MTRGHTYEKWQELGYQVKKGERHSFNYYGNKCFTRDQVVRVDYIDEEEESYLNHCWNCKRTVNSDYQTKCSNCGWLECSSCQACGCNYGD